MKFFVIDKFEAPNKNGEIIRTIVGVTQVSDYGQISRQSVKIIVDETLYNSIKLDTSIELDVILPKPAFPLYVKELVAKVDKKS